MSFFVFVVCFVSSKSQLQHRSRRFLNAVAFLECWSLTVLLECLFNRGKHFCIPEATISARFLENTDPSLTCTYPWHTTPEGHEALPTYNILFLRRINPFLPLSTLTYIYLTILLK